jgi:hypothetical protein
MTRCIATDPITNFEAAGERNRIPKDAKDDDILACSISNVGAHFKCREALPFHVILVP